MDREVQVGKIYRHFKGNYYRVILIAKHTETGEKMVIYQALYSNDNTNYGYFLVHMICLFLKSTTKNTLMLNKNIA